MSVWTNPSLQRSASVITNVNSEIGHYARLTLSSLDPNYKSRDILVFPGMEYRIRYLDSNLGIVRNTIGLVENVYGNPDYAEPCIQFKYIENDKCTIECSSCNRNCSNKNKAKSIPICNCVLNPPNKDKYKEPITCFIPLQNIIDIEFDRRNMSPNKDLRHKGETKVMILGISATTLKSIVIHLEFLDDSMDNAIKYVDLTVNNIYDVSYFSRKDDTTYEIRGKLISIHEYEDKPCKPGKGFVRETVCHNNNVTIGRHNKKKDFIDAPPVKRVKLVFDTSEDFSGKYETILLEDIRDCKFVSGESTSDNNAVSDSCNCCCHRTDNCTPDTYGHSNPHHAKHSHYKVGDYSVTVCGDNIKMTDSNNNSINITMDELLGFYLGV